MNEKIIEIDQRLDAVWAHIVDIEPYRTRLDLIKMHQTVEKIKNQLHQEMVNCKRNKKTSQRARDLLKEIQVSLDNLEEYLTMGILISK